MNRRKPNQVRALEELGGIVLLDFGGTSKLGFAEWRGATEFTRDFWYYRIWNRQIAGRELSVGRSAPINSTPEELATHRRTALTILRDTLQKKRELA